MIKSSFKFIKKIVILIFGLAVVVLGIILIPLPGPGLLVVLVGLFILSLEFDWADRYVQKIKVKLKQVTKIGKDVSKK